MLGRLQVIPKFGVSPQPCTVHMRCCWPYSPPSQPTHSHHRAAGPNNPHSQLRITHPPLMKPHAGP